MSKIFQVVSLYVNIKTIDRKNYIFKTAMGNLLAAIISV